MADTPQPTAVVLLSGGLDSATVAAVAKNQGYRVAALSFRYGQRHARELDAAAAIAADIGVARHVIVDIDLRAFGGSALTDDIDVPKHRADDEIGTGIPVTYVPARNTIFMAHALALAEVEGSEDLFIGVNALDYSGYPDCRPEYIAAFQTMARLATKAGVEADPTASGLTIRTPLMELTKAGILALGTELGVDYVKTLSCYDPPADTEELVHCGACDACLLRRKGFSEAGLPDPTVYAA
jgi:7-cyano-7-deazaguanine synthase